jgi:hypothetical protein
MQVQRSMQYTHASTKQYAGHTCKYNAVRSAYMQVQRSMQYTHASTAQRNLGAGNTRTITASPPDSLYHCWQH